LHFNQFFFGQNISFLQRGQFNWLSSTMLRPSARAYLLAISGVELADKPENPVIGSASDGNRCSNLAGVSHLGEGSHNVVADTLCDLFCVHIESTGGTNPGQGMPTNEK
jgi:hypothetical protein